MSRSLETRSREILPAVGGAGSLAGDPITHLRCNRANLAAAWSAVLEAWVD